MVKVSAIIPVYNVEEYLSKCLDSVINQTLKDIEIIIVNDGSKDNSEKIIKDYQKKDKRIVYIKKENGGQGSARNLGLKKTRGEYISFIDSDDWIDHNMFELMYNKAKENELEMVICGYKNIYNDKKEICLNSDDIIYDTLSNKSNKIFNIISPCCKLYNRKFLINSGVIFLEEKIWYEDFAYSVNLLSLTNKIDFVNVPFYNYRIRDNSTMRNTNIIKNLDLITIFEEIIGFYKENNKYEEFYSELEYLAIDNILISGITRVVRISKDYKTRKKVIHEYFKYMIKNFPNYKDNKYLNRLSNNRKIIYRLILLNQYWLVRLIFKIKN